MMAVIKSGEAVGRVATPTFREPEAAGSARQEPPPPDADAAPDPLKEAYDRLQGEYAALERTLRESEEERDAAFEKGRQTGREEAERREAEKVEKLADGLAAAQALFAESLTEMESYAVRIARACLDRLFGDPAGRAEIVADLIAAQIEKLGEKSVPTIAVSPEDFESTDAITERLEARFGPAIKISRDKSLTSGACHLGLAVGGLEIGIDQQWGRLAAILDDSDAERAGG